MSANAHGIIRETHYLTTISSGKNTILSDEPIAHGGMEKGMNPYEILASALVACTCATLRMYIDRKQWTVSEINVNVELERDTKQNITNIERNILLTGELNPEQHERLLFIAKSCPVHKLLTGSIEIQTKLI